MSNDRPGLEPIRKLIRAGASYHSRETREEAEDWNLAIARYAYEALPALRSLLAEVARLREENVKLKVKTAATTWWQRSVDQRDAAITKAAEEGLSHAE